MDDIKNDKVFMALLLHYHQGANVTHAIGEFRLQALTEYLNRQIKAAKDNK